MRENDLKPSQVTVAVETSVSQTLTALELRSLLAQLETAVWEQMTASHMVLQEAVVNALVSANVMKGTKAHNPRAILSLLKFVSSA